MTTELISLSGSIMLAKEELLNKVKGMFEAGVYPLYYPHIKHNDRLVHAGSAFALEYQGKIFFVTAAHVISHIPDSQSGELYAGIPLQTPQYIGTNSSDAKVVLSNDTDDFALIEISGTLETLVRKQGFASEGQLSFYGEGHDEHYYVCLGYPHSKNKVWDQNYRGISMQQLQYETTVQNDEGKLQEALVDPTKHLALQRLAKRSIDSNGNMKTPYGFKGMSGGLVVDAGALGNPAVIGDTTGVSPKAIAIIIEYHSSPQTIKGLRLSVLKSAMQCEGIWP